MSRIPRIVFVILFILYVAAVSCLCFLRLRFTSQMQISDLLFGIRVDRIVHSLMFVPFLILSMPMFGTQTDSIGATVRRSLVFFVVGALFAASTEIIQQYIPYREGDVLDFLADIIGLSIGMVLYILFEYPILSHGGISHRKKA